MKAVTARKLRGDPAHPVTRGFLCGKVARYLGARILPERLLYPQRRIGAKGEAASRASPGTRRSTKSPTACSIWRPSSDRNPSCPTAMPAPWACSTPAAWTAVFPSLGASRLDRTICSSAGGAGLMAALGVRYGTEPEQFRSLQADHRVGREHPRHQRSSVAVHRRSPPQRRASSTPSIRIATAPARSPTSTFPFNPGSDAALALGDDARHHSAKNCTTREYVAQHTAWLRRTARAVSREWTPAARRRTHRHRGRRHRRAGARVRHHAPRRHPR